MKKFIAGIMVGLIITACAMGGKSSRLKAPMDPSKTPWDWCTPEMIVTGNAFFSDGKKATNHKGNLCLIKCELKLKADGSCKKDKYKYAVKEAKKDHDFFMNKFICVPENTYY